MNLNPFNVEKLAEKLMKQVPDMPDMSAMMGGYEFKDGALKAGIDYWTSDGRDLDIGFGMIRLFAAEDVVINKEYPKQLDTTLALNIKPPNIAFKFQLVPFELRECIVPSIRLPNDKDCIFFHAMCRSAERYEVKKGDLVGLGYFIPIVPTNNIAFTNQNATT